MAAQIADDIRHGGIVEIMDRARTVVQAMAVKDGRIIAVGSDADALDLAGPGTRRHALGGKYVMPGLVENHGRERAERCHPIGDLLRAGAEITYASDWPAAAADANPWTGLAGMISRRDPTGRFPGTLAADQKHLGAKVGFTSVLHSWGSAMTHHLLPGSSLHGKPREGAQPYDCSRRRHRDGWIKMGSLPAGLLLRSR